MHLVAVNNGRSIPSQAALPHLSCTHWSHFCFRMRTGKALIWLLLLFLSASPLPPCCCHCYCCCCCCGWCCNGPVVLLSVLACVWMWILYPELMCVTIRTQLNSTVCSQKLQPANSPEQVRKPNEEAIYGEDKLLTIHNHSNWSLFIMVMNSGGRRTLWISRQEPQQTRISTDGFGSRMHRSALDNARKRTLSSVHRALCCSKMRLELMYRVMRSYESALFL